MKLYTSLIVLAFILFSCATQKEVAEPKDINTPASANALFSSITKAPAFQDLKISSKIQAETGKFVPPIDATIYMEKDQKVWMNFSALFLNVGRGLATPSGVQGYEKWNKTYVDTSYDYLNSMLNVNFIDLGSFQKLLIGKTFIPVSSKDFEFSRTTSSYTLRSKENQVFGTNGKRTEYQIILEYTSNFDLKKVLLHEINSPNQLEVYYDNFTQVGAERFASNVKLVLKGAKEGQILIQNTKFEPVSMNTPYSVPSGYTKVTIK